MKKIYFWSPHINPHVATLKSVHNSLNSLLKYGKDFKLTLINVFGEWDEFRFESIKRIDLILNRNLIKRKYKGFFNSRILYSSIFLLSYYRLKNVLKKDEPDYLIIHLITSIPILLFLFNNFRTKLILRVSGLPKLNILCGAFKLHSSLGNSFKIRSFVGGFKEHLIMHSTMSSMKVKSLFIFP